MIKFLKFFFTFFELYNKLYNSFLFKVYNVSNNNFDINGRVFIRGKGKINIGNNFKANSGSNYNPIGGDTKLRLICKNTGEISIGENVGISNSTLVCWNSIVIEDNVMIGGGCKIWDTDFHTINTDIRIYGGDNETKSYPIRIKKNAFIGGASVILKGVVVGENSIIAAGSVVSKNIPKNEIWGGNPAKLLRKLN